MSRIAASRSGRVYRRDAKGRFAKTGTSTSHKVVRAAQITAVSLAGVAVAGAAVSAEIYHRNTAKLVEVYRRNFKAEQQAAEMDRRVEKLIEKHRKRQRLAAARAK